MVEAHALGTCTSPRGRNVMIGEGVNRCGALLPRTRARNRANRCGERETGACAPTASPTGTTTPRRTAAGCETGVCAATAQVVLRVFPGALGLVRSELSAAPDRGGVAVSPTGTKTPANRCRMRDRCMRCNSVADRHDDSRANRCRVRKTGASTPAASTRLTVLKRRPAHHRAGAA